MTTPVNELDGFDSDDEDENFETNEKVEVLFPDRQSDKWQPAIIESIDLTGNGNVMPWRNIHPSLFTWFELYSDCEKASEVEGSVEFVQSFE